VKDCVGHAWAILGIPLDICGARDIIGTPLIIGIPQDICIGIPHDIGIPIPLDICIPFDIDNGMPLDIDMCVGTIIGDNGAIMLGGSRMVSILACLSLIRFE